MRALGFEDGRGLARSLDQPRFANLETVASQRTLADFISHVRVCAANMEIGLLADIVSFSRPVRPTSAARMEKLERNMLHAGIYMCADSPLTVCLERNVDAAKEEVR